MAQHFSFPHNYNYISRATMYKWFNKHLKLGLEDPILEENWVPLTAEELSVHMQSQWQALGFFGTIQYIDSDRTLRAIAPFDRDRIGFDMSCQGYDSGGTVPGEMQIFNPFLAPDSGQPTVRIAWATGDGGIVVGGLNLGALQEMLITAHGDIEQETFFIASGTGTLRSMLVPVAGSDGAGAGVKTAPL